MAVSPVGAARAAAEAVAWALDTPTQPVRCADNKPISNNIRFFLTWNPTLIVQPPELARSRAAQPEYVTNHRDGGYLFLWTEIGQVVFLPRPATLVRSGGEKTGPRAGATHFDRGPQHPNSLLRRLALNDRRLEGVGSQKTLRLTCPVFGVQVPV